MMGGKIYRNEDKGNDPGKFGVSNKENDANEMMQISENVALFGLQILGVSRKKNTRKFTRK